MGSVLRLTEAFGDRCSDIIGIDGALLNFASIGLCDITPPMMRHVRLDFDPRLVVDRNHRMEICIMIWNSGSVQPRQGFPKGNHSPKIWCSSVRI